MVADRLRLSLLPQPSWAAWLAGRAPLFPSSDWLCLEGSGGDGKSPAPFSHAVLAASAPHSSDLCVCCWHSTSGLVVNFGCGCCGTELSFEYLSPQIFRKVNVLHSCAPSVLFPLFSKCAGIVTARDTPTIPAPSLLPCRHRPFHHF